MATYAGEYTPEVTQGYLENLERPIYKQGAKDVGTARGEALRRGLTGDPFEALRVGAAQNTMNTNLANTNAGLAWNVAGQQQQERVGTERLASEQAYGASEAQKARDYQTTYAAIQQQYAKELAKYQNKLSNKFSWKNALSQIGTYTGAKGLSKLIGL